MSGREQILATVRRSLKRPARTEAEIAALEARVTQGARGPVPARAQLDHGGQVDLFEAMARELSASVTRLSRLDEVPAAVADYLKEHNLAPALRRAPHPELEDMPWDSQPLLEVTSGVAQDSDAVSLTGAFAAVAETGTLLLASGPEGPTTLNFLPETHIVVLKTSQMVGPYEDAWDRLRAAYGPGEMPRTVNMISGPSRTGDIEQTILLGAHGPRRLHILIVEDGAGDSSNPL